MRDIVRERVERRSIVVKKNRDTRKGYYVCKSLALSEARDVVDVEELMVHVTTMTDHRLVAILGLVADNFRRSFATTHLDFKPKLNCISGNFILQHL